MAALVVGFVVLLSAASHTLPERVASHFDSAGQPDGWTDRAVFLWLMGGVGLAFPMLFVVLFVVIRFAPRWLPPAAASRLNSDGPGATLTYLLRRYFWFGSMMIGFIAAVQGLIIEANTVSPPRLQTAAMVIVVAGFTVGVMVWAFSLLHHFWRVRRSARPI